MTESKPITARAALADRDHRAEIVDRLYDVAVDPIRLEELRDVWEGRAAPLRYAAIPLEDPEMEAHVARARVFLDRYEAAQEDAHPRSPLADITRSAAFLSDGGAVIVAANPAAGQAFGIRDGGNLADLPFAEEELGFLAGAIHRIAARKAGKAETLRLRSTVTGSPVILRISPVEGGTRPTALVVSTELVWPDGFAATVQDAFGLTLAEVEIVRGVTLGHPLRAIAEARGRSVETVRTQVRSILAKTETHSQAELVRVVLGLMDLVTIQVPKVALQAGAGALASCPLREMRGTDGRRLTWIEFGDPAGAPVLYMHLDFGFIRWPAMAERAAAARGLRVVVPVRAGYGQTGALAKGEDHLAGVTRDYATVLDHLGLRDAVVVPMGADLRFAMNLANTRPDLVRGIVGAACQLPIRTPAQYDRMDKWQRFILGNARHAPKLLPFMVQAGFGLARRLGKEAFFRQVNGGSPADMAAFSRPDIRVAVLEGSEVTMTAKWSAHAAFTAECIGSEKDWSEVVRAVQVPVLLLQGDEDPQAPVETMHELVADYPGIRMRVLPGNGQLLLFSEWPVVLDEVGALVRRNDRVTQGH